MEQISTINEIIDELDSKQNTLSAGANINIETEVVSKNLWNPTNSTNTSPGFNAASRTVAADGTISITNNSGNVASRVEEQHTASELGLENGKIYTITVYCDTFNTTDRPCIIWYNGTYTSIQASSGVNYITFTWTQADNSYVQVGALYFSEYESGTVTSYKIQLEQGNIRTDYVAWNVGESVPVISAIDTTYTAGSGIDITNDVISVDGVKDQNDISTAIKTWTGTESEYEDIGMYYAFRYAADYGFVYLTHSSLSDISVGDPVYVWAGKISSFIQDGSVTQVGANYIRTSSNNVPGLALARYTAGDRSDPSLYDGDTIYVLTEGEIYKGTTLISDKSKAITSSDVTTALGYTPYNSNNPRGYITGVAWGDVSGTLSNQTDLYNELYYKTGDTFSGGNGHAISSILASGCLTASRGSLFFSFALPKRLTNISTVTINSIVGGVRGADGGYIVALGTDFSTIGTLTATISSDNYVTIYIQLNTASTQTNNTPISVMMYSVRLSFS